MNIFQLWKELLAGGGEEGYHKTFQSILADKATFQHLNPVSATEGRNGGIKESQGKQGLAMQEVKKMGPTHEEIEGPATLQHGQHSDGK